MDQFPNILLVDDEPALVGLMKVFLTRQGYTAETAENGTVGLEMFRQDPGKYALVVADLTLPDMQGDKMALEMVGLSTTVRILLCSGYPFELRSLPKEVRGRFGVLQKPFLPDMLTKAVSDLLPKARG